MINILKNLTERTEENNKSPKYPQNQKMKNRLSKVTTVIKNYNKKRVPKIFKTGIDFDLNEDLNIFHLIHDENIYANVHWSFNRWTEFFYIPRFSKKFQRCIEYCFNCQFIQTKKHKPYGELMFIIFPFQLFHIITIDFVFVFLVN